MTNSRRVLVVGVILAVLAGGTGEAWARAASGGSRGSRSYSPPARPAPMSPASPSAPSREPTPPLATPVPRPSPFGGIMGALGGFIVGGLLGSLLFGGLGQGFGIGLFDLLLIGGAVLLLFRLMRNRREEPAYAGAAGYGTPPSGGWNVPAGGTVAEMPLVDETERGLTYVRQMDPGFDAAALAADAAEVFRAVQEAVTAGDLTPLRAQLTPDMFASVERQCDELRRAGRANRVERIQIERAEVTEAWQERGHDFVTVLLAGSLIDYTVDAAGTVVAGSRTGPERFEEFWTFTRPVGPNVWKLTAIQSA